LISRDIRVIGECNRDLFESRLSGRNLLSKPITSDARKRLNICGGQPSDYEAGNELVKVLQGATYLPAATLLARVGQWGTGTTMMDLEGTATDPTGRDP
jgi:hypothetical protein